MGAIKTREFTLEPWQVDAVDAWKAGDSRGAFRGTLEIFTGGGKTLIALEAAAQASALTPSLQVAIVVPTEALAHHWRRFVTDHTNVGSEQVGLLGAGAKDTLEDVRVLVAVINSAAEKLPGIVPDGERQMLIVDECHRAGAPSFQRVLDTAARYRLGLSATPDREDVDEEGEPIEYDADADGSLRDSPRTACSLDAEREDGEGAKLTLHDRLSDRSAEPQAVLEQRERVRRLLAAARADGEKTLAVILGYLRGEGPQGMAVRLGVSPDVVAARKSRFVRRHPELGDRNQLD